MLDSLQIGSVINLGEVFYPKRSHGICEVRLSEGKIVYEGKRFTVSELRRMAGRSGSGAIRDRHSLLQARTERSWATSGNTSFSRPSRGRTWVAWAIQTQASPC